MLLFPRVECRSARRIIKAAVTALGSINIWKVAMKPGKPFLLGEIDGNLSRIARQSSLYIR